MAWVPGAFYVSVAWLAKDLRTYGYPLITTQGMLIGGLLCNAAGVLLTGYAFDRGAPAIFVNAGVAVIGGAAGFAALPFVGKSAAVAWAAMCAFQVIVGAGKANAGLPCTRIYKPLEVREEQGEGLSGELRWCAVYCAADGNWGKQERP
jgi:hypothetical protein